MDEELRAELAALRAEIASLRREVAAAIGKGTQIELVPEALEAKPAKRKLTAEQEAAIRIFVYWREQLAHPEAKFTNERKTKVLSRVREYGEEKVKRAILGCARSSWHRGENDKGTKYDDLELICRSGRHVERFAEMADKADGDGAPAANEHPALAALREKAELALQEGKTSEFNEINERIRHLSGDRRGGSQGKGSARDGAATSPRVPREDRRDH